MKKNMRKWIAMSMAFAVMSSTVAFAAQTTTEPVTATEATVTTEATETTDTQPAATAGYIGTTGKVTEIAKEENGNIMVTIDNENGGLRFVVAPTTVLVDRETNAQVAADQLKKDMTVCVVYLENAPMGMSMPPYLGQVAAVVTNADKGNVSVGMFNDELINEAAKLQLNIADKTPILTTLGTKSILGADDVKGKNAVVLYDITTRSIPAQTTPSMILLLEEAEMQPAETQPAETAIDTVVESKEVKAPEMVNLRDAAEKKGYNVVWQGKDKPVLVSKEDVKAEINLGSASYTVDGKTTLTAQAEAALKDGVLCVSADVIANLK